MHHHHHHHQHQGRHHRPPPPQQQQQRMQLTLTHRHQILFQLLPSNLATRIQEAANSRGFCFSTNSSAVNSSAAKAKWKLGGSLWRRTAILQDAGDTLSRGFPRQRYSCSEAAMPRP